MVQGLIALMESPADFTGPVNLGNMMEITIQELAERIIRLSGSSSSIKTQPPPPDDPTRRWPDIDLARKIFTWEPTVKLGQALESCVEAAA